MDLFNQTGMYFQHPIYPIYRYFQIRNLAGRLELEVAECDAQGSIIRVASVKPTIRMTDDESETWIKFFAEIETELNKMLDMNSRPNGSGH